MPEDDNGYLVNVRGLVACGNQVAIEMKLADVCDMIDHLRVLQDLQISQQVPNRYEASRAVLEQGLNV